MKRSAAALLGAGWVLGWLLAGPRRLLRSVAVPAALPSVSVIVPARDEQSRLPRLLAALAAARPAPDEVIVVDDGSSDDTAGIARRAGATVLTVAPPEGWSGKAWACHQGAMAATGDVLVFLDADTEPSPDAVALLAAAAEGGELVSVQPRHRVERPYEAVSIGPGLVTLLGAGTGGPPRWRWWRRPMAFGPAIAVRRDRYERFGGHGAAPARVAEDLALARAADRAGVAVRSYLGGDRLGYRMYPEGPGQLVEGWSKHLATGAGEVPPVRLVATVAWVAAVLRAAALAVADPGPATGLASVAFAVQFGVLARRLGRFGWVAPALHPLHLVAFLSLFARSVLLALVRGEAPWRGRQVPVRVTTGAPVTHLGYVVARRRRRLGGVEHRRRVRRPPAPAGRAGTATPC